MLGCLFGGCLLFVDVGCFDVWVGGVFGFGYGFVGFVFSSLLLFVITRVGG